jgi:hypothetical protein
MGVRYGSQLALPVNVEKLTIIDQMVSMLFPDYLGCIDMRKAGFFFGPGSGANSVLRFVPDCRCRSH